MTDQFTPDGNFIGALPNFSTTEFLYVQNLLAGRQVADATAPDQFAVALQERLGGTHLLIDSARAAWDLLLAELAPEIGVGEVIITSFTCVVIVNPILWHGFSPRYVDIQEDDFNNSVAAVLAALTSETKVILLQHTFGRQFPVAELRAELRKLKREDVVLVEDLAHVLGIEGLAQAADFALLSFGIEKAISSVRGGSLAIAEDSAWGKKLAPKLRAAYEQLPEMPTDYLQRLLLNAQFWGQTLPRYYRGFGPLKYGKIASTLARRRGLLGIAIRPEEYAGGRPEALGMKLPAALAELGLQQLAQLEAFNTQRAQWVQFYAEGIARTSFADNPEQQSLRAAVAGGQKLPLLRYPIVMKSAAQAQAFAAAAKAHKIILGDWYRKLFYTSREYLPNLRYELGTAPTTEALSPRVVNLPTHRHTTRAQAELLLKLLAELG